MSQGAGSQCTAPEGCCFPDGSCANIDPLCCEAEGGDPQGAGSVCLGDTDGDGTDDLCQAIPIPTVSQWGLAIIALALLTGIAIKFGRHRTADI